MAAKNKKPEPCVSGMNGISCCKVESIVSVDERGQMVLPKETREKAKIKAGDKLAIISGQRGEEINFICLIKVEDLTELIKGMLGPMMKEIMK